MGDESGKSILDYDLSIVETLKHIEDIQVKFSIQNYASAGAIFLAHFTKPLQISLGVAAILVSWSGLFIFGQFGPMPNDIKCFSTFTELSGTSGLKSKKACGLHYTMTTLVKLISQALYQVGRFGHCMSSMHSRLFPR